MKRQIISALVAVGVLFGASAISVNENELRSANGDTVVFENYQGPHAVIETIEAIRGIGIGLGRQVSSNVETAGTFNPNGKYSVIHAIDPTTKGKLDADIFVLNSNASVDHIRNLRWIIAAYLSEAYGYNDKDAATVATFITVYNAVYRGNTEYFSSKYKDIVSSNLSPEKCGLSTKWSEWPGKTQIVIPLGDFYDGGISSVDTSVISDKKVVDSMKEEDDKGVDERKNLVDIKEREAENASAKAQEAAKTASEESKKLEEQKQVQKEAEKQAAEKQAAADEAKKDAEEKKAVAEANPGDKQAQKDAAEAEKQAQAAQDEADSAADEANSQAAKTEEQQQKVNEASEEAAEQQALADKKQSEAQNERKEIAKDQQSLIKEAYEEAEDGTIIGLKITDSSALLSSMVKVNATTGRVSRQSPVTVIRGRTIYPVQDPILNIATGASMPSTSSDKATFYMAVCGENGGVTKLCLLDSFKMEIQKESEEELSPSSVLVNNGANYYVVIKDEGNYVVGRYDKSLALTQKSTVSVDAATPIVVTGRGIVVTTSSGTPALLSLADLSLVSDSSEPSYSSNNDK